MKKNIFCLFLSIFFSSAFGLEPKDIVKVFNNNLVKNQLNQIYSATLGDKNERCGFIMQNKEGPFISAVNIGGKVACTISQENEQKYAGNDKQERLAVFHTHPPANPGNIGPSQQDVANFWHYSDINYTTGSWGVTSIVITESPFIKEGEISGPTKRAQLALYNKATYDIFVTKNMNLHFMNSKGWGSTPKYTMEFRVIE